jgi:hypothetical protein
MTYRSHDILTLIAITFDGTNTCYSLNDNVCMCAHYSSSSSSNSSSSSSSSSSNGILEQFHPGSLDAVASGAELT